MFAKLKESLKNNTIEYIVGGMLLGVNAIIIWFWGVISKSTITFKLPVIVIIGSAALLFLTLYIVEKIRIKKLKKEIEDFINPISDRLQQFKIGDQVIRTIDRIPNLSTITKIVKGRVYCKDRTGKIDDFAPEELRTASETKQIINRVEAEKKYVEQQNADQWESFFHHMNS